MNLFGILIVLDVILCGFLIIYRVNPSFGAYLYTLRKKVNKQGQGSLRKNAIFALAQELESHVPQGILERLERMVRYAGKPQGLSVAEWILIQFLLTSLGIATLVTSNSPGFSLPFLAIVTIAPFMVIRQRAKKRRFLAREYTRRMKRQFHMQLVRNVKRDDALRNIAESARGEFGETFRKYIGRMSESLSLVMQGLRDEYGIPELDQFALAIEVSEQQTSSELIKELARQIADEDKYVDRYLEDRKQRIQVAQNGAIFMLASITLGAGTVFAFAGISHLLGQGGLLG